MTKKDKKQSTKKGFVLGFIVSSLLMSLGLKSALQKKVDVLFKFKGKFRIRRKRR